MTELERQLAAYTEQLEARSLARSADHPTPTVGVDLSEGDVIVFDLQERRDSEPAELRSRQTDDERRPARWPWLAVAAAVALIVAVVGLFNVGDEGAADLDVVDDPDPVEETDPVVDEPDPIVEPDIDAQLEPSAGTVLKDELLAAYAADDETALRALWSPDLAGTFNGGSVSSWVLLPSILDTDMTTLAPFAIDCGIGAADTIVCDYERSFDFLDDVEVVESGTWTLNHDDGVVTTLDIVNDNHAEVAAAYAAYADWLLAQSPLDWQYTFRSDAAGSMMKFDAAAAELHAEYGPQYNAQLAG